MQWPAFITLRWIHYTNLPDTCAFKGVRTFRIWVGDGLCQGYIQSIQTVWITPQKFYRTRSGGTGNRHLTHKPLRWDCFCWTFQRHSTVLTTPISWRICNLDLLSFLVRWLSSFWCQRQQRVKMGSKISGWNTINAGVPLGALLGPAGLADHLHYSQVCRWHQYIGGGAVLTYMTPTPACIKWSKRNLGFIKADKTKAMTISFSRADCHVPPISVDGKDIEYVPTFKLLSISWYMGWSNVGSTRRLYLYGKCAPRLCLLTILERAGVSVEDILKIYNVMIRSVLGYACQVLHTSLTTPQSDKIESIERRSSRRSIICPDLSHAKALDWTGESPLHLSSWKPRPKFLLWRDDVRAGVRARVRRVFILQMKSHLNFYTIK